ncbi:hypothetical protein K469DRAFT_746777 [Zopfia rhizophila CBS 207.26]|uniref:Uncharacterized protein n=1 Tax=Zopfia rhizophila CBS 207.26 TaxID=1314779 RepID=A0A6A6EHB5_9PEZI|nr:hypothetical protein K469DRAFT_746777 [Zopfia rhizophila CBS 207.26]
MRMRPIAPQTEDEVSQVTNIYESLELEEPKGSYWIPDIRRPTKHEKNPYTYKMEPSAEETPFAVYCFLKGAIEIRSGVNITNNDQLVSGYATYGPDLSSSTLFCETTIRLILAFMLFFQDPGNTEGPELQLSAEEMVLVKCLSRLNQLSRVYGDDSMTDQALKVESVLSQKRKLYS